MSEFSRRDPLLPFIGVIKDVIYETEGLRPIKTFTIELEDDYAKEVFQPKPGQCAMVGIPGVGESMFSITSFIPSPHRLQFSIMKVGKVTSMLHNLEPGDKVTVRGPYGNCFPVEEWEGKNIVTIGGGIGQAPLRPIIYHVINNRDRYGKLTIFYGARSTKDLCFKYEYDKLRKIPNTELLLSIDNPEEGWKEYVGFVPNNVMDNPPDPKGSVVITCGPPIMIKFVLQNLNKLGFEDDQIYTTLERRMKCGIGKCGRCNINHIYICKDGPVFSLKELKNYPEAFE